MAFWTIEQSIAAGIPVELHAFHADGTTDGDWYYADAPQDITYDGNLYVARYAVHGEKIEQGSNALKNQTIVKADWDCPFVAQYLTDPPEQVMEYARYKAHGGDTVTQFTGTVAAVRYKQTDRAGNRHAEIIIDPTENDLRKTGLVTRSGRQCQVCLYSAECGILRAAYRVAGTVITVSRTTVTGAILAGYPVGWFRGGDFVASAPIVGTARRKIIYHVGNTVILSRPISGLVATAPFDAYPGCDHTKTMCNDKFANLDNYRGQDLIPDNDPWEDRAA